MLMPAWVAADAAMTELGLMRKLQTIQLSLRLS
jgi:hypothetical protein